MAHQAPKDPMAKVFLLITAAALLTTVWVLVSNLFNTIEKNTVVEDPEDTSMQVAAADKNVKPVGHVTMVDKSIAPKARSGEDVYKGLCFSCHDTGAAGAPKVGDKDAWQARFDTGMDALLNVAINGKGGMPAKGGDASLSDDEIKQTVIYMLKTTGFDVADTASSSSSAEAGEETANKAVEVGSDANTAGSEQAPSAPNAPEAPVAPAAPKAPSPETLSKGEGVYKQLCFSCHDTGVAGAPKVGDVDVWTDRIAAGSAAMYETAINGKGAMPAKGGNPGLSDEDVKAAVDYMAFNSMPKDAAPVAEDVSDVATSGSAIPVADAETLAKGEGIYKQLCFSCHDAGIAGAPKVGDKPAWTDRLATGIDAIYATAINGKGAMPAKGGNPGYSDEEVKAAVDYMLSTVQ